MVEQSTGKSINSIPTKLPLRIAEFCYCIRGVGPVPVAALSKTLVFGRSPAEIVGSNPTGGMDVYLLWVLCVVR
jgi:hypothetical protein